MQTTPSSPSAAVAVYHEAVDFHRKCYLHDAGASYRQALALQPSRAPSPAEVELILAHAPRAFTTPDEPLPLKDFAAVLHPDVPLIGYHFFWEDDIDFPLDREPCDHEVIWVQLDAAQNRVAGIYTYYHSHVLSAPEAVDEARQQAGRPRIDVQWGKHGSLPVGWQHVADGAVLADMERTYRRLYDEGCRDAGHPLARGWPRRFTGSWEAFIDFSQEVDTRQWLQERQMMMVGTFANATIFWHFLRYNFSAKYSWPDLEHPGKGIL